VASFVERISVIIDTKTDQATSALKSFRTEVAAAEGFVGKFKAGLGSLQTSASNFLSSGAGMATAATAVSAGMWKAATASADLGVKIGTLADATGLSTEAASRWIEVSDDMGIGADTMAGLIEKMTKNLGGSPEKFEALGISMQYAKDGTADMNATLINAIDRIQRITDPTKRAKAAADLFGKSWADASELIGMSSKEIAKRLGDVGDAKVFSQVEVDESRQFRDSMADLGDTLGDLVITIGKDLVPVLAGLAGGAKDASGVLGTITDDSAAARVGLGALTLGASEAVRGLAYLGGRSGDMDANIAAFKALADAANVVTPEITDVTDEFKKNHIEALKAEAGIDEAADAMRDAKRAADALNGVLEDQADAYERAYEGAQDLAVSSLDVADAAADLADAQQRAVDTANDETASQAEKEQAYRDAIRAGLDLVGSIKDQALASARAAGAQDGTTASAKLQIAELERQKAAYPGLTAEIDEYIRLLGRIPGTVQTNVRVNYGGGAGGTGADGTGVSGDTGNLAGGVGTPGDSTIESVGKRGASGVTMNLTFNGVTNAREIVDLITAAVKDGQRAGWMNQS